MEPTTLDTAAALRNWRERRPRVKAAATRNARGTGPLSDAAETRDQVSLGPRCSGSMAGLLVVSMW